MIYFIDEDLAAFGAWLRELELRGREIVTFWNATDAFRELWRAPAERMEIVIIDVMLDPGEDASRSESWTAGLELLRDLCQQNPRAFPDRAVLLTNSVGPMLQEAVRCGTELGVPVWDKRSIISPVRFGDLVEDFIAARGTAS